jgi:molecular chaperone DnaK
MVEDAQAHADEDKKRRELVDQRNQADGLAYSIEKTLNDNRDKVEEAEAKSIEEAIAEVRKTAEGEDLEAIKAAMDKLTKQSHKLAEELYKQQAPGPEAGGAPGKGNGGAPEGAPPPPGGPDSGDVVDAEYTVKD